MSITYSENDMSKMAYQIMNWRSKPLPHAFRNKKTTDPETRDYERSIELFREGLRAARRGDLSTGRTKIAAAYLLDYRSGRWYSPVVPPIEFDPEAQDCLLDLKLFMKLAGLTKGPDEYNDLNIREDDPAPPVLAMFFAQRNGGHQQNQEYCTVAFHVTQQLIDRIAKDPTSFEHNPAVLEGCLTRASIHHRRADLFAGLNNPKNAARELKKAVKLEPNNMKLRAEYTMTNYEYCLMGLPKVFQFCKEIVERIHPDNRRLRHLYAIMAPSILEFPALGTLDEAFAYYEKMKQAEHRQIELHGESELQLQNTGKFCRNAHEQFAKLTAQDKDFRRHVDEHLSSGCSSFREVEEASLNEGVEKVKHLCMNCQTGPHNNVKLRKCSRCKQVYYCSAVSVSCCKIWLRFCVSI